MCSTSLASAFFAAMVAVALPARGAEQKQSFVVLIDCSGSILPEQRTLAMHFVDQCLSALPEADVAIALFGSRVVTALDFGVGRPAAGLKINCDPYRTRTVLYDAIFDASQRLASRPSAQRGILVLTDGRDAGSDLILEDSVRVCLEKQIPVFMIGIGNRLTDKPMRRISKLTGGFYAPLPKEAAIAPVLRQLARTTIPSVTPQQQPEQPAVSRAELHQAAASDPVKTVGTIEDRGGKAKIILFGLGGVLLAAAGAFLFLKHREPSRVCPSCGQPIEGYFTECPNCRPVIPVEAGEPPPAAESVDEDEPSPLAENEYPAHSDRPALDESTVVMLETPVLIVKKGKNLGAVYPVPWCGTLNIGRSRTNNIVVEDRTASGEHCRLKHDGEKFILYDLKSTNGSFVNDHKVSQSYVKDGDTVQVGETHFLFKVQRLSS